MNARLPALPVTTGKVVAAAISVYGLFAGLLFYDTLASMVTIWLRSQTFAHGFLILPISLWLAWRLRSRFLTLKVAPQARALWLVLAAGLVWLGAHLVDVQIVQQLAFVAVLVAGVWAIAGTAVARCYAFPLGFLFLAVPMGAGLIPPLMQFTADTTEFMLRASGIPVFREGMYLSLSSGTWSIIEECSGVRYLIASFTLGLLYAYLTYQSLWRRAAFVAAAITVPILANSLRAYGLVMVGHLSDTRLGVGDDHLVYGWVFFGLVMLLMFWIGGFWQQNGAEPGPGPVAATESPHKSGLSLALVTGLAVLSASVWPALSMTMNRGGDLVAMSMLQAPAATGTWRTVTGEDWDWQPARQEADRELLQHYATTLAEPVTVGLHLRQYLHQRQGAELVSSAEPWRPDRQKWRVIAQERVEIDLGLPVSVDEVRVSSPRHELLVWSWYAIDGRNTANPFLAKLLEAQQQLLEGRRHGTRLFVTTAVSGDGTEARQALQQFVTDYRSAITAALDRQLDTDALPDAEDGE